MDGKLDAKDRKILYELDKNARQPAAKIAKKVGLSTDGVNYRIKQLIKKKAVFKFMMLLDTAKIGLTTYKVFYRLQNTTPQKENEIISFLSSHSNTQFVAAAEGAYDLNINFVASSAEELDNILAQVNNRYGEFIAERQVTIMVKADFFFRDYLVNKKTGEIRKPMFFGSTPAKTELDEKDKKILVILAQDARMPAVSISGKIRLSSDAVIKRIRKMENAGIIQNYVLFPNPDEIRYKSYFILLRFRNLLSEKEKQFFTYCRLQPNIWFYSKLIGSWDCAIDLDVEDDSQFKEILMSIKKDFSEILKEYNILRFTKTYKFNQYPMAEK